MKKQISPEYVGDITLNDAFYELLNFAKDSINAKIKTGVNPKKIKLIALMDTEPETSFKWEFEIE